MAYYLSSGHLFDIRPLAHSLSSSALALTTAEAEEATTTTPPPHPFVPPNFSVITPRLPACAISVFTSTAKPRTSPSFPRWAGLDHIYVVHYTRLASRKVTMLQRLNAVLPQGWEKANFVSFLEDFDKEALLEHTDVQGCLRGYSASHGLGTISLSAKHLHGWFDMIYHNYSTVLMLEDDAGFVHDFDSLNKQIIAALPSNWSNCVLTAAEIWGCAGYKEEQLLCPGTGSRFAYGYMLSQKGARQVVQLLPITNEPDIRMDTTFNYYRPDFVSMFTVKSLILHVQDGNLSTWHKPIGQEANP